MDIRNCKSCGRIFNYVSGEPLCPTCKEKLEDKFEQVKQYIYDNPRVGITEVSQEMEVSVAQIKRWVREERLTFSDDSPVGIECECCGAMIKTGRFCKNCKDGMVNKFNRAYETKKVEPPKKNTKENPRMRFLQ